MTGPKIPPAELDPEGAGVMVDSGTLEVEVAIVGLEGVGVMDTGSRTLVVGAGEADELGLSPPRTPVTTPPRPEVRPSRAPPTLPKRPVLVVGDEAGDGVEEMDEGTKEEGAEEALSDASNEDDDD